MNGGALLASPRVAMPSQETATFDEAVEFFELSPDVCCVIGAGGHVIRANPATECTLGYSPAELGKYKVLDLVHPEDQADFSDALELLLSGTGPAQLENRFRRSDGAYLWLLWNAKAAGDRV